MKIFRSRDVLLILTFTLVAIAVMGYHPGFEDDGVYLSGIKSDLNPALYPHDAEFFRLQLEATTFDKSVAAFVRITGISVAAGELLIQAASILLIIAACWAIARRLFAEERARWAGVAMVASMLTLPVAGSALNMADQHLHPRNIATAFILVAVSCILAGKRWQAVSSSDARFPVPSHHGGDGSFVLFVSDSFHAGSACLAAHGRRIARCGSSGLGLHRPDAGVAQGARDAHLLVRLQVDLVRMARRDRAVGSFLAALALRRET